MEKPSFKDSIRKRRCLIPASGWYEWSRQGVEKQPYYIQRKDGEPLLFAGIWARWRRGDTAVESCSILTMDADETVRAIHHRMPVILERDDWDLWLDNGIEEPSELSPLYRPPETPLTLYPVSKRVNYVKNDDPACLEQGEGIGHGGGR